MNKDPTKRQNLYIDVVGEFPNSNLERKSS